jgi:hypothetical protein
VSQAYRQPSILATGFASSFNFGEANHVVPISPNLENKTATKRKWLKCRTIKTRMVILSPIRSAKKSNRNEWEGRRGTGDPSISQTGSWVIGWSGEPETGAGELWLKVDGKTRGTTPGGWAAQMQRDWTAEALKEVENVVEGDRPQMHFLPRTQALAAPVQGSAPEPLIRWMKMNSLSWRSAWLNDIGLWGESLFPEGGFTGWNVG